MADRNYEKILGKRFKAVSLPRRQPVFIKTFDFKLIKANRPQVPEFSMPK